MQAAPTCFAESTIPSSYNVNACVKNSSATSSLAVSLADSPATRNKRSASSYWSMRGSAHKVLWRNL